ncbi:MAG: phosphatidate cytidylyltransferase [Verrucomicrobiia bacterium]
MLAPRIFSFLVLWAAIIGLIWFQLTTAAACLAAIAALLAQWEFYSFQQARGLKVFQKSGVTWGAVFFALCIASGRGDLPDWLDWHALAILVVIIGAISRQVFEKDHSASTATIALTILGFFYIPYLFHFLIALLFRPGLPGEGLVLALYLIAVTKMTDAGAYLTGSFLGRHKMIPRISPGKTWEGFIGGILAALLCSLTLVHFFPDRLAILSGPHAWILGLGLGMVSVVGDLGESLIKRDAHIKNSGSLIPGIGGFLDLVDSLLFTGPLFYFYLLALSRAPWAP